jgi:Sulfotransferase domain
LRPVIKLVNWDAGDLLSVLPQSRSLFILRHPCGQVASVMRGVKQGRFKQREGSALNPELELSAASLAASHDVDAAAFRALPEAARHAWNWRAFNEPAIARLETLPNARLILYEDLCTNPAGLMQELFRFVGLAWHAQTAKFVARSTRGDNRADYYAVFRSTTAIAQRWRQTMAPADQEAVRMVVRPSPVAHHWPELCC